MGLWSEGERKGVMATIGHGMSVNRVFSEFGIPGRSVHSHMKIGESQ
jgi:hypothetical protein